MKKTHRRIVFVLAAVLMIAPFAFEELLRQGILNDSSTSKDRTPINSLIFGIGFLAALFCVFDKFYGRKINAQ